MGADEGLVARRVNLAQVMMLSKVSFLLAGPLHLLFKAIALARIRHKIEPAPGVGLEDAVLQELLAEGLGVLELCLHLHCLNNLLPIHLLNL